MKKIRTTAMVILICCICQHIFAQAFLKSYTDPTNQNAPVSFECITENTDSSGNLYIGGHIGDTITLFKMSTAGIVLATYKIKTSPSNTKLDAIMLVLDAPTNTQKIVVLGNVQAANGNQGFIFRFNRIFGTVDWFNQTNPSEQIAYWDMADKAGTSYIVSGEKKTNGSAMILKINKLTGLPSVATNYIVAGLEDPEAIQFSGATLYATGRYALPGGNTNGSGFRFCFSRFDASFTHIGKAKYYITPAPSAGSARMYSTDILVTGNAAIMVGHGDDNNTTDAYENLNITKVNAATGAITWSRKYDNPSAASDGALTEIRLDDAGKYTVMGFGFNSNTGNLDKAKLWSVNPANGNLIWNRQYNFYRRTKNNGSTYGYGFTIIGSYIYAVGQNNPGGITKGVLLKVNTANGNVSKADGTSCASSLNIQTTPYTFYDSIPVNNLTSIITSTSPLKQVVKTKMNDSLLCGTVVSTCCKLNLGIDGGSIANAHPNCGDTVKGMQCTGHYYFSPVLTCDSTNTNSAIISVSIKDAFNNIPSWAVGFNGTGNLTIPTGVSGVYTLSYSWGSNGVACDSCKYYLNITCCDASCKLSGTIRPPRSRVPQPFNCGDTALATCNNSYDIVQTLKCNIDSSTQLVSATLTDPFGGIPSWAAAFMANLGNGTLAIPTGINSGIYTLT